MLKAKALCAVKENVAPEIKPLVSVMNTSSTILDKPENKLCDLISGIQNIVIESVGIDEEIPDAVVQLAVTMMKSNALIRDLLYEIRQLYIRGVTEFRISLVGKSESERKKIVSLFQDMDGLVSNIRYVSQFQTLNGSLIMMPKVQRFLTGQYLELAVYVTIKEVLNEMSVKYKADYEIYRNVRVADREGKIENEFDVAFEFNGIWYIAECKTGKCFSDWGNFLELGITYNIIPNRLLLVDSYISDSKAERIEYFCEYYVCNLSANSLKEKVIKMITNDNKA